MKIIKTTKGDVFVREAEISYVGFVYPVTFVYNNDHDETSFEFAIIVDGQLRCLKFETEKEAENAKEKLIDAMIRE